MDNSSFRRKCIEELATSPTVVRFDVNKITPSKDFDAYDYNLFLNFASQAELEGDYCVSETFTKIEEYKIQGLTPRVDVLEDEESGELEEVIKYVMKYYEPQRTSKTTAPKP
jgi:hypothetical protein